MSESVRPLQEIVLVDPEINTPSASSGTASSTSTVNAVFLRAQRSSAKSIQVAQKSAPPVPAQCRKPRSIAWHYFVKEKNGATVVTICKACGKRSTVLQSSTTNMRDHLENIHPKLVLLLYIHLLLLHSFAIA
jgi:hypothetical protein